MKLYLIRHFQTRDNLAGRLQGRQDTVILPPGEDQAADIAANAAVLKAAAPFDHVLVSQLRRTHQTAEVYGFTGMVDPLLDELDFGPWQGRPKSKMIETLPAWFTHPGDLVLGEPLVQLEGRVRAFASKYAHAQRVLAFGHGAWSRAMVAWHRHGSIQTMNQTHITNNAIITLEFQAPVGSAHKETP